MVQKIHTELVTDEGIIEGHQFETYYQVCLSLIPTDEYLRVVSDGGFTDSETRIPYEVLKKAGFVREQIITDEIPSGMSETDTIDLPPGVATVILGVGEPPMPPDALDANTIE